MKGLLKWVMLSLLLGSMFVALGQSQQVQRYLKPDRSSDQVDSHKRKVSEKIPAEARQNGMRTAKTTATVTLKTANGKEIQKVVSNYGAIESKKATPVSKVKSKATLHQKATLLNEEFRTKGQSTKADVVEIGGKRYIQVNAIQENNIVSIEERKN